MPLLMKPEITEKIVPTFIKATTDKVPNVQFCVAKIIAERKQLFDQSVYQSQIVPKLKEMLQDPDKDVAYFATVAL